MLPRHLQAYTDCHHYCCIVFYNRIINFLDKGVQSVIYIIILVSAVINI